MNDPTELPPLVTADCGPAPAGRPGQCVYCCQPIGERHKPNCPHWTRPVRLRVTFEYVSDEPMFFDADGIRVRYNEGTWCADNLVATLERLGEQFGCLCNLPGAVRVEMVDDSASAEAVASAKGASR